MEQTLDKVNSVCAVITAVGGALALIGAGIMSIITFLRGIAFAKEVEKACKEQ